MAIPKQHYRFAYEIESKAMAEYPKVEKFIADFFEG